MRRFLLGLISNPSSLFDAFGSPPKGHWIGFDKALEFEFVKAYSLQFMLLITFDPSKAIL